MTATHREGKPLVLIHGAWLSARSWENFAEYFGGRGFAVSAPEWPRKHGDVEELREATEEIKGLGLTEIVDPQIMRAMRRKWRAGARSASWQGAPA